MTATQIHTLINESSKGLPNDILEEILDFIQFLKNRKLTNNSNSIQAALTEINFMEENHLIEEFKDYKTIYPKE